MAAPIYWSSSAVLSIINGEELFRLRIYRYLRETVWVVRVPRRFRVPDGIYVNMRCLSATYAGAVSWTNPGHDGTVIASSAVPHFVLYPNSFDDRDIEEWMQRLDVMDLNDLRIRMMHVITCTRHLSNMHGWMKTSDPDMVDRRGYTYFFYNIDSFWEMREDTFSDLTPAKLVRFRREVAEVMFAQIMFAYWFCYLLRRFVIPGPSVGENDPETDRSITMFEARDSADVPVDVLP